MFCTLMIAIGTSRVLSCQQRAGCSYYIAGHGEQVIRYVTGIYAPALLILPKSSQYSHFEKLATLASQLCGVLSSGTAVMQSFMGDGGSKLRWLHEGTLLHNRSTVWQS
jgi:hypothetical protein